MAEIKQVKVGSEIYDVHDVRVPNVTSADNSKIVSVSNGQYTLIPNSGGNIPEITFTIGGRAYTAKLGQTFGEWIWTAACTLELRLELSVKVSGNRASGYVSNQAAVLNASGNNLSDADGIPVNANAQIEDGMAYLFT